MLALCSFATSLLLSYLAPSQVIPVNSVHLLGLRTLWHSPQPFSVQVGLATGESYYKMDTGGLYMDGKVDNMWTNSTLHLVYNKMEGCFCDGSLLVVEQLRLIVVKVNVKHEEKGVHGGYSGF